MKITKFDKPTIRATRIGDRSVEALKALAAELGLTVEYAGGTFDDAKFTCKVSFKVNDPAATERLAREQFNTYCRLYDMTPDHFGGQFLHKGSPFTIVGIEIGRPKFCIKARGPDGKVLLFPQSVVARVQPVKAAA